MGMIALNTQPFIALAQTATSGTGVAVFSENFNSTSDHAVPTGWTKTGDWGVVEAGETYGKVLYGDSANFVYLAQTGARITSPSIDLSSVSNANISFVTRCDTEYTAGTDFMTLQVSGDGTTFADLQSWNEATIDSDSSPEDRVVKTFSNIEIPSQHLTSDAKIAFVWTANAEDNDHDGCFIDDVVVTANGTGSGNTDGGSTGTTTDNTDNNGGNTGTTTDNTGGTATTTPVGNNDGGTGTTTNNTGTTTDSTGGTSTTTDNTGGTSTTTPGSNAGSGNNGNTNTTVHTLDSCATLVDAGATYRLTRNVNSSDTCFEITADNITLDGAGFEVLGDRGMGHYGVRAEQHTGITIKNLALRDFEYGVWFTQVDNSTIENARLEGNSYGFVLHGGNGTEVKSTAALNNGNAGIYLKDASNSMVQGITATDNEVGIHLDSSDGNTVRDSTTRSNDRGILLTSSNNNVITSNTSSDNVFGIALEMTSNENTISSVGLTNNYEAVAIGSGNNTFSGLDIEGTRSKAIRFFEEESINNTISDTRIVSSQAEALDLSFDNSGTNSSRAGVNGTVLMNTPITRYFINNPGGTFTYGNSFGSIMFTSPVTGSGMNLSEELKIENGRITIGSGFDGTVDITFATSSNITDTSLLKDGVACDTCTAGANGLVFSVTGEGVYELQGTVSTSTSNSTTTDNGTGTSTNNTGTTTNNTGTTTNNTGTTTNNTGTTTNNTGTTTDSTGTTTDSTASTDEEDSGRGRSRSFVSFRTNGVSAGDVDDIPADVEALIAIIDSPEVASADDGSGTTIIPQGTGGAETNVEFGPQSNATGETVVVDDGLTGTGGPDNTLAQNFGTTSETAAVTDAFDDENPNRLRNIGIGALILIIVIAIIFGMSRGA